jgi:cytochrome b subunit of formate dehydrogenase
MVPLIMLTGLTMTFHWLGAAFVAWAMVFHFFAVGMVVSGLMIHVYMGAVFPEEKPAFYSMITGTVDELYAYRHHFKWWRAVKIQEQAWRAQLRSNEESAACCADAKPDADSRPEVAPLISRPQSGDRR